MITVNQIIAFLSLDDARRTHARASAPENTGTVNSENTPARRARRALKMFIAIGVVSSFSAL